MESNSKAEDEHEEGSSQPPKDAVNITTAADWIAVDLDDTAPATATGPGSGEGDAEHAPGHAEKGDSQLKPKKPVNFREPDLNVKNDNVNDVIDLDLDLFVEEQIDDHDGDENINEETQHANSEHVINNLDANTKIIDKTRSNIIQVQPPPAIEIKDEPVSVSEIEKTTVVVKRETTTEQEIKQEPGEILEIVDVSNVKVEPQTKEAGDDAVMPATFLYVSGDLFTAVSAPQTKIEGDETPPMSPDIGMSSLSCDLAPDIHVPKDSGRDYERLTRMRSPSTRKKRKHLIIDKNTEMSGDAMKAQLLDASDLIGPPAMAPPTKKICMWQDGWHVKKLLSSPGRTHPSETILKVFKRNVSHFLSRSELRREDILKHDKKMMANASLMRARVRCVNAPVCKEVGGKRNTSKSCDLQTPSGTDGKYRNTSMDLLIPKLEVKEEVLEQQGQKPNYEQLQRDVIAKRCSVQCQKLSLDGHDLTHLIPTSRTRNVAVKTRKRSSKAL